ETTSSARPRCAMAAASRPATASASSASSAAREANVRVEKLAGCITPKTPSLPLDEDDHTTQKRPPVFPLASGGNPLRVDMNQSTMPQYPTLLNYYFSGGLPAQLNLV